MGQQFASLASMYVCPLHALSFIAANSVFANKLSSLQPNWWDISSSSPTVSISCELLHHWLVLSLAWRSSPICSVHLPWRNPWAWRLFCNGGIGMLGFGTILIIVEPLLIVTAPRLIDYERPHFFVSTDTFPPYLNPALYNGPLPLFIPPDDPLGNRMPRRFSLGLVTRSSPQRNEWRSLKNVCVEG